MDLKLSNKKALITSASKGIGRGIAFALAKEGCDVIITSSNSENLNKTAKEIIKHTGASVTKYIMDAENAEMVSSTCKTIISNHHKVDILITNAPGPETGQASKLSDLQLSRAIQINLLSVIQLCRHFVPEMQKNKFGRVINIGSSTGREPEANMALSNLTRAAVMAYAKTLSREVAKDGVTVNTILTGGVLSERTKALLQDDALRAGKDIDTFLKEVGEEVFPIGYIATPEQFAPLIVFLASQQSQYVTGVNLPIDGGLMRAL